MAGFGEQNNDHLHAIKPTILRNSWSLSNLETILGRSECKQIVQGAINLGIYDIANDMHQPS
jgi:hypothetical protein